VSGELTPDATGTYQRIADVNGYTAARRIDDAYTIYWSQAEERYILIPGTLTPNPPLGNYWATTYQNHNIEALYYNQGETEGNATFTWT